MLDLYFRLLDPFSWAWLTLIILWLFGSIFALVRNRQALFCGVGVFLLTATMWSQQIISEHVSARDTKLLNLKFSMIVVEYNRLVAQLRVEQAESVFLEGCLSELALGARERDECFPEREDRPVFKSVLGTVTALDTAGDRNKQLLNYFHFALIALASFQMAFGELLVKSKESKDSGEK